MVTATAREENGEFYVAEEEEEKFICRKQQ